MPKAVFGEIFASSNCIHVKSEFDNLATPSNRFSEGWQIRLLIEKKEEKVWRIAQLERKT